MGATSGARLPAAHRRVLHPAGPRSQHGLGVTARAGPQVGVHASDDVEAATTLPRHAELLGGSILEPLQPPPNTSRCQCVSVAEPRVPGYLVEGHTGHLRVRRTSDSENVGLVLSVRAWMGQKGGERENPAPLPVSQQGHGAPPAFGLTAEPAAGSPAGGRGPHSLTGTGWPASPSPHTRATPLLLRRTSLMKTPACSPGVTAPGRCRCWDSRFLRNHRQRRALPSAQGLAQCV